MFDVLQLRDLVPAELEQRRETGYDVRDLEPAVADAVVAGNDGELEALYRALEALPDPPEWPYEEPSSWEGIQAALADSAVGASPAPPPAEAVLADRIHAAWLGRCAGCTLGKPFEAAGWDAVRIREYLELAGAWPLRDYAPALDPMPGGFAFNPAWPVVTRGNVRGMARDDDLDYTILGLHVLEACGRAFGPGDVGAEWLDHLPFTKTFTAERAAYRNLVRGLRPPATATFRNPYREWIGALIRADMWGYVCPGDPGRAVRLAYADASLSHVANGIYGALWATALTASCFVARDMRTALATALEYVPPRSRLYEALALAPELRDRGLDWESARTEVDRRYGHYSWVHTVNNAAVVAVALLWGEEDFGATIGYAVQAGWDTDCAGATAGSAFGAMHGTAALPLHWLEPLDDRIATGLAGVDASRISELAARTVRVAVPPDERARLASLSAP
jgi:ADP-ribosylglycohydrolase